VKAAGPVLSIVVPCFNEEPSLAKLLEGFAAGGTGGPFELLLVDNGSTDGTDRALRRLAAEPRYAFARSIRLPENLGYGGGIRAGLEAARGQFLAWTHADLQCDPADVFAAFDAILASRDPQKTLVKGLRRRRAFVAELTTRGMHTVARFVLQKPFRDINGQPKVFHRSLLRALVRPPSDLSFDLYVLNQAMALGWSIATIPVVVGSRPHGRSKWATSWLSRCRHVASALRYMVRLRRESAP